MSSFDFERVLTIGASGQVGSYIDFGVRPDSKTLDITNESHVEKYIQEHEPSAIIHLAAAADMVRSEQDLEYVYGINVRGTYNVARAARNVGAVMVYASSSRVFNGDKKEPYTETDIPEPETQYGRTKHIGEMIVSELVPQHIIARTAWVFGGGPERDNKFYGKVIKQLQSGNSEVVALQDVHGSPTYAKDYIQAIKMLLADGQFGIYHIANAGVATRYDIAKLLAKTVAPHATVQAVDRTYFPNALSLPTNESISSASYMLRDWREALAEYLKDEWMV